MKTYYDPKFKTGDIIASITPPSFAYFRIQSIVGEYYVLAKEHIKEWRYMGYQKIVTIDAMMTLVDHEDILSD